MEAGRQDGRRRRQVTSISKAPTSPSFRQAEHDGWRVTPQIGGDSDGNASPRGGWGPFWGTVDGHRATQTLHYGYAECMGWELGSPASRSRDFAPEFSPSRTMPNIHYLNLVFAHDGNPVQAHLGQSAYPSEFPSFSTQTVPSDIWPSSSLGRKDLRRFPATGWM